MKTESKDMAHFPRKFRIRGWHYPFHVLFDEPEAALSPQRQLTVLAQILECAEHGSQFIIATHSPILLGLPGAQIFRFGDGAVRPCRYEDTESYQITEMFINHRQMMLDALRQTE